MIVEKLEKLIKKVLTQDVEVTFEHPENFEHGDYSSNVALVLGQQTKQNPRELAEKIAGSIEKVKEVERIEVAGAGFLNFFLAKEYLVKEAQKIVEQKEKYGLGAEKKKVMIEFTDPNPFKEFHIGHLYSNAAGESLSRLLVATGAEVKRVNYQGDVGLHVAKAIWGMQENLKEEGLSLKKLGEKDLSFRMKFLGQSYAKGDKAYVQGIAKEDIEDLNIKIFAQDKDVQEFYELGRKWSLEAFEQIYKRLGTKFDYYYFESDAAKIGKKIVEDGVKKGVFEKSQGAIIFPGEKYGLHTRVFINSQGLPTYEAKDLGLAPTKYKDFPFDLSLSITGNEQKAYFQVVFAALKEVNSKLGEKMQHISHGMVRLPEGKMSSRTGNIVTGEGLIDEVKSRVQDIMKSSENEMSEEEKEIAVEIIAVGAVKYSLLRISLGRDIIFDFEKSLSLEGESGPYIQYTYARCKSILRQSSLSSKEFNVAELSFEEEKLLRLLYRFPEVVRSAAQNFSPHMVASFVFDIAQAYNNFYAKNRVLQADTKEQKDFRLLLTAATAQIIQNSLNLLGIKTLERM
mgnify:CR=1 FL=1